MTDAIPFDGLPEKYDSEEVGTALRQAFLAITDAEATPDTSQAQAPVAPYADFTNVKTIGLTHNTGGYATALDRRVAYPTEYAGSGLSATGRTQRFRFDQGTHLYPLMRLPCHPSAWAYFHGLGYAIVAAPQLVAFGAVVPGIRHDLGRVPERVVMRSSASNLGPRGQLIQATGGTIIPIGTGLRCDFDFLPIFGTDREDVERATKHLLGFSEFTFAEGGAAPPAPSNFENAVLHRSFASELVTTRERFGGVLIATCWALPTFQANIFNIVPAIPFVGGERHNTWVMNGTNSQLDPMAIAVLPEMGKSIWGATMAAASLATLQADGLRVTMTAGSVDFVLE